MDDDEPIFIEADEDEGMGEESMPFVEYPPHYYPPSTMR